MAARRGSQIVTLVAVVAALIAVWWLGRGEEAKPTSAPITSPSPTPTPTPTPIPIPIPTPIPTPTPTPIPTPIPTPSPSPSPSLDLRSISNPDERAAITTVVAAIDRGGPFPYRKDGATFENREQRLPSHARGYWREYTVPTPGSPDRGARRLVGGDRRELYYSRDHYRSFIAIRAATP
jgi:ribonuclease T1